MDLYNGHTVLFFTGIYCCAVFCLIGMSIVETIFVNYLKVKASNRGSVETTSTVTGQDGKSRHILYFILLLHKLRFIS